MKYQVSPPPFTTAVAVAWLMLQVSSGPCTRLGEQCWPVSTEDRAPVFRCTLSFSRATVLAASATAVLPTWTMASTPPRSNHSRTMALATSGLFWWSAATSSTATPGDRKSTRLNSSHANISYAVFCLKKKNIHHLDRLLHENRYSLPTSSYLSAYGSFSGNTRSTLCPLRHLSQSLHHLSR